MTMIDGDELKRFLLEKKKDYFRIDDYDLTQRCWVGFKTALSKIDEMLTTTKPLELEIGKVYEDSKDSRVLILRHISECNIFVGANLKTLDKREFYANGEYVLSDESYPIFNLIKLSPNQSREIIL